MAVANPQITRKYVFAATEVPEECVRRAQVVIVCEFSWHLIAPNPYRMHCMMSFAPVPTVACPVIDARKVTDDEGFRRVVAACVDPSAGVINLDGLVTGLTALGAVVSRVGVSQPKKKDAALMGLDVTKLKKVRRVRRKARVQ